MEDMTIKYEYDFSYDDTDDLFDDEYDEDTLNEAPDDVDDESSGEDTDTTDGETSEDTDESEEEEPEEESSEEPEEESTEDTDGEIDTDIPGDEDDSTENESEESDNDSDDENSDQSEGEKYIRLRYFESLSNMDENFEKLINKISLYKRNLNNIGHLNELIQLESVCREAQNKISTIKISFINTIELDILKKINNEIQRIFIRKVNELKKLQDTINKSIEKNEEGK